MTVTYPHDRPLPLGERAEEIREEPFVPVYARSRRTRRGRKGGLKTWMILAPIGVLVLGAGAAAMIMGGGDDIAPAPLVEPAATAPVAPPPALTIEAAPVEPVATAPIVEAAPTPVPVARRATPAPAPARRAAAPRATAPALAPAARVAVPAEPTAPQPYTATLNAAPTPAPAPPPVIVIQPAD